MAKKKTEPTSTTDIDLASALSAMTAQKLFFEALVLNIPFAVVTVDANDCIATCNLAFEEMFGYKFEEVAGKKLDELINSNHTNTEAVEYTRQVQSGQTVHKIGLRSRADGSQIEVDIYGVPVMMRGKQIGSVAIYNNLTKQRKTEEQLRESRDKLQIIASIDPLTGIPNRRAITEQIQNERDRAQREGGNLALALIDLDNLKEVNDNLGHLAGDLALQKIADAIGQVSRPYDRFGRWGGDEFMLVVVNVSQSEAMAVANRILEAARNAKVVAAGEERALSVSIGLTCCNSQKDSDFGIDDLFSLADEALYQAKSSGRNTVKFMNPD